MKAPRKNSAGTRARDRAQAEEGMAGLKKIAGYATAGAAGLAAAAMPAGAPWIIAGGVGAGLTMVASARRNEAAAANSRNRGAALDHLAKQAKMPARNAAAAPAAAPSSSASNVMTSGAFMNDAAKSKAAASPSSAPQQRTKPTAAAGDQSSSGTYERTYKTGPKAGVTETVIVKQR